jgi:SAM-dependent methyltransferase
MSTQNKAVYSSENITDFYTKQLKSFGDSPKGVGWKNDDAQNIRFAQLVKVIRQQLGFSINDLGCGTGKLYTFLLSAGYMPNLYNGYDMLDEMIVASKETLAGHEKTKLIKISSSAAMETADYTVASGIFNVRYEAQDAEWLQYVLTTLEDMNSKSTVGFAFNLLTKYSDPEFMQSYLYYADPLFFFDHCKRNYARNVALLHDYDQYDFTIIVRK